MAQIKGIDKKSKNTQSFFFQNCEGIKLPKYFEDLNIEKVTIYLSSPNCYIFIEILEAVLIHHLYTF